MTTYDYDVLYIGSGHGTFDGAIPLGAKGVKVGVIEQDLIGGTCPNRGCNAKIVLDSPVALQRHLADVHGVMPGEIKIDWAANQAHKQTVIAGLPAFIQGLLDDNSVDVLFGLLAEGTAYALVVWGPWKRLGILWKAVILSLSVALFIGVELSVMVGAPFWLTSAGLFVGTFLAVELGNLMISKTALAKVV